MNLWKSPLFLLIGVLSLAVLLSCDDDDANDSTSGDDDASPDDDDDLPGSPALAIVSGNLQAGIVDHSLPAALEVRLTDQDGNPVAGETIAFTPLTGADEGAAVVELAKASAETDEAGLASCPVRAGDVPGMARIRAGLASNRARPVIFNISVYPEATAAKMPICFLSINDLHAHLLPWGPLDDPQGGVARLVWAFREIRKNNALVGIPTVILNGGDDFENTAYYDVPGFMEWLIAVWDRAGMDVWQVGNHDIHFGIPFLTRIVTAAAAQFTAGDKGHPMEITFGNVDPSTIRADLTEYIPLFETDFGDASGEKLYQQTTMIQAGEIRVGVLGVVTDAAIYTQVAGDPAFLKMIGAANPDREMLTFFDPDPRESDYINRGIDALAAEGADVIVVASHSGLGIVDRVNLPRGKDDWIARYGQGPTSGRAVDLIISAHSHVQLNHPILLENPAGGRTPIVQAREGGLFISRVDAVVDTTAGGLELLDGRLLQVNGNFPEDEQIASEADAWAEQTAAYYADWPSGDLVDCPAWLSHRANTSAGIGNLINNSFLWKLDQEGTPVAASVAIPSLYRADLWPGPVNAFNAYDVLPLHKMDEYGDNPDTIALLAFRPGRRDYSTLLLPGTWRRDTTGLEYMLEFFHTLPRLQELVPFLGKELKIEVFQITGVSYEVDYTAPIFHRVVPGTLKIDGRPIDPERTYQIAMVETLATTVSNAAQTLIKGRDSDKAVVSLLLPDAETGKPYSDTYIPIWQALQDYLAEYPTADLDPEEVTVTGDVVRPEQPDLAVNATEMTVTGAQRGQTATVSIRVRNLGNHGVQSAKVRVFVDSTPWDLTDQDDGMAVWEGLGADYLGSLVEIAGATIELAKYPTVRDLTFAWDVPEDFPPGSYTLHVKTEDTIGYVNDPHTGQPYTDAFSDNDSGEQVMNYFTIDE